MVELLRSNDPVLLSYVEALLGEAEIGAILFDQHTSVLEGSIGAIQRRIMVEDRDHGRARRILAEAGVLPP